MGKTFKDGRIDRDSVKQREKNRTIKHQTYGSKERKTISKLEQPRMSWEE